MWIVAFRVGELLPWRDFVLETKLSAAQAGDVLAKNIGAPRLMTQSDDVFTGKQTAPFRFTFRRTIRYRNSFAPIVKVEIEPSGASAARVHVRMRLHVFVAAFMSIWMSGALLGGLAAVVAGITQRQPIVLIFGAVFPMFGVALCGGGFAYEARQTTELLHQIFPPAAGDPPYR